MPFYTGKSADGSDMREFEGVYLNPDNPNEWSSTPYSAQQIQMNIKSEVLKYMDGKFSLDDVHKQILNKNCPLSKRCREFVLSHYDENGEFVENSQSQSND